MAIADMTMTADSKDCIERLKLLSARMLADADLCEHFPTQQKLLDAAATLIRKAEEIDGVGETR